MIKLEPFFDEPIVIFRFIGEIDQEQLTKANADAISLLDSLGVYYAVLDTRQLPSNALGEAGRVLPTLTILENQRIHWFFLGDYVGNKTSVPTFEDEDTVLRYIREQIANQTHNL
jgi:hypothetical protein